MFYKEDSRETSKLDKITNTKIHKNEQQTRGACSVSTYGYNFADISPHFHFI